MPVPNVIAWNPRVGNPRVDNPVGAEYIVMEEAPGKQIGQLWNELNLQDRTVIVRELVSIQKKLLSASFTWYVYGMDDHRCC